MATILVTWELGGGSGHVVPLRPIIEGLVKRGHVVVAALRDLGRAASVFHDCPVRLLQAPFKVGPVRNPIRPPFTFAQILHDCGFAETRELQTLVRAWRALIGYVKPDVMVCDHSPTALLASRGMDVRRVVAGFGFICPPDVSPLPNLRTWDDPDPAKLAVDESLVLGRMNKVLESMNQPPIERVTQIYGDADATLLTTFEELDHFRQWRPAGARYYGAWTLGSGVAPQWPTGKGPKVFAYLRDCPALAGVLKWLADAGHPTIACVETPNGKLLAKVQGPTFRSDRERLDMGRVAAECHVCICHAPHGTTAAILLAGKPLFLLPTHLEQALLARAACDLGAAVQAPADQPQPAVAQLADFVSSHQTHPPAARKFADQHAHYNPAESNDRLVDRIESLTPTQTPEPAVARN